MNTHMLLTMFGLIRAVAADCANYGFGGANDRRLAMHSCNVIVL